MTNLRSLVLSPVCHRLWLGPAVAWAGLGAWAAVPAQAVVVQPGFVVESATPGATFDIPTAIAFLPDGRMLVAEKKGRVFAVKNAVKHAIPMWSGELEVLNQQDRGLLDVAVDPNYAANRYIYLLYTVDPDSNGVDQSGPAFGRLTRYQVSLTDSNVVDPASRTILMGVTWTDGPCVGSPSHTIGSLRWAADGSLLVSIGEGANFGEIDAGGLHPSMFGPGKTDPIEDVGAFRAQFLGSLAGKILRIDPATGHGYPSNPFYDGDPTTPRSKIWAYGFRNPFRFTVKPGTGSLDPALGDPGVLYIGDVGWFDWEETNVATQPGQNFGWPCYEGIGGHSGYQAASPSHSDCGTIGSAANPSPHRPPIVTSHHDLPYLSVPSGFKGGCAVGGAFYVGTLYPAGYVDRYFFADFSDNWIKIVVTDANHNFVNLLDFAEDTDGPVDLVADPISGDLFYVAIYTGEVRRIRYEGSTGNNPPVAVATGSPSAGGAPLTVSFSSAGSYDPDGDALSVSWLFGDLSGASELHPEHTYTDPGVYRAVLTVEDGRGLFGRDTVMIFVSDPGAGFPTTSVLDNFDRPDGPVGGSWVGDTGGLVIDSHQLTQISPDSWTVWDGAEFGTTQEVYVTFDQLTAGAPEHDLMLKVQGLAWHDGHIEVQYVSGSGVIRIHTYAAGLGWVRHAEFPATLQAGDQFGARANGDGRVEVYVNGMQIGDASVVSWPFYDRGGRLGVTLVGASSSRLDDFGGGDLVIVVNTPPTASILSPPDGTFFAAGDTILLSGDGDDAESPPDRLTYHWQVDLHHNTHVHPSVFVSDSQQVSFEASADDDGTGAWLEVFLHVTDEGGLRDTTRIALLPELDLMPSRVTTTPDTVWSMVPAEFHFAVRNLGRMPAPVSRYRLVAGTTVLAEGDTLVGARDSCEVTLLVTPTLAPGTYDLRLVVDTLDVLIETDEENNASVRSLTVLETPLSVDGPGVGPLTLSNAYPNPSAGRVRMALDLPRSAEVKFAIYDLQGREVWSQVPRRLAAGRWSLEWNGKTRSGERARPALYLARVTVEGRALTRRIAVIR